MSTKPIESNVAAGVPTAMSVDQLENVTGGSFGGLLEGVGEVAVGGLEGAVGVGSLNGDVINGGRLDIETGLSDVSSNL